MSFDKVLGMIDDMVALLKKECRPQPPLTRDYLRATPTAAGPSSSKRSVLWRTRGFAALGFDCSVVVGAVSGACFV